MPLRMKGSYLKFFDFRHGNLFSYISNILFDLGEISGETIFIDGTKIEANANKYTFVWKKAVEKNTKKQTRHSMEETAIQKQMKTPLLCA